MSGGRASAVPGERQGEHDADRQASAQTGGRDAAVSCRIVPG